MGSYCELYVGDCNFSWKGVIPDIAGLLFAGSDYRCSPLDNDADTAGADDTWYEHRFLTSCRAVADRLNHRGISLQTLEALHFWAFAFDETVFVDSLRYRCASYLEERLGDHFTPARAEVMVRRLLRHLRRLSGDQEFAHVLRLRQCTGTREDCLARLEAQADDLRRAHMTASATFNRLTFSRQCLREFLDADPYDNRGDRLYDEEGTGSSDLDTLYDVGMAVLASAPDVPVEMDFTEIVDGRAELGEPEVNEVLEDRLVTLKTRATHTHRLFGSMAIPTSRSSSNRLATSRRGGATARGVLFEQVTSRLFEEEPGFTVHRRVRQSDQEVDIAILNRIADPFWTSLQSPFLLVECRNRREKVQAKDLRDFEVKLANAGTMSRIGLIVSMSGFTRECKTAALRSCREGYRILLVDRADIMRRLHDLPSTRQWLEELLLQGL